MSLSHSGILVILGKKTEVLHLAHTHTYSHLPLLVILLRLRGSGTGGEHIPASEELCGWAACLWTPPLSALVLVADA